MRDLSSTQWYFVSKIRMKIGKNISMTQCISPAPKECFTMLHLNPARGPVEKKWKNPGPPAIIPASDFFLGAKPCIRDVKPPVPPRSSRAKLQQNSSTKMHIRCWRPQKWPPWHFRSDVTLNFYQFPWLSSFSFSFPILTLRSTGILGQIEISLHNFSLTSRH